MSLLEMTPAPSTIGVTRTIADAKAGSKGLLASVALVYVVLTCLHVVAVSEGPSWTSPLLIGDHLFDLLLAVTMLWFALALGRRVAWPLLGLSSDLLTERLAACGLGLGLL